ncbi:MAG: cyclase family protein [Pseudobdellovibrionaceae bacterium]
MPYVLSPIISCRLPGLWGEGSAYSTDKIYDLDDPKSPPVRYQAHTIKPHSVPHLDAPAHILKNGPSVDWFYKSNFLEGFYGDVVVIRLKGDSFAPTSVPHVSLWEVSIEELKNAIQKVVKDGSLPNRLLVTVDSYPEDSYGHHDPNRVLVLSEQAAEWLVQENNNFKMYGTSWKSSDYRPNSSERLVHKIFMSRNIAIFECLNLRDVPEGIYFWTAFPLPLEGASESPVCPVLFTVDEITTAIR